MTDSALRLAGYFLADGSHTGYHQFRIVVSRPWKIEALQEVGLFTRETLKHDAGRRAMLGDREIITRSDKTSFTYPFSLIAGLVLPDKQIIADSALALSQRQARIAVDALLEFDGSENSSGARRLSQLHPNVRAAFEVLAVQAGLSVSAWTERDAAVSEAAAFPVVRGIAKNRASLVKRKNVSGEVWCVTVPSGLIVVRRRGFSMLCGNCTEAQALRMAFPEFSAGYTAEEMEGKTVFAGQTIDAEPAGTIEAPATVNRREEINREVAIPPEQQRTQTERTEEQWKVWLTRLHEACSAVYQAEALEQISKRETVGNALATGPGWVQREIAAILAEHSGRLAKAPAGGSSLFGDDPEEEPVAEKVDPPVTPTTPPVTEAPVTPIVYGPVAVPKNGPNEDWAAWVNLLRSELPSVVPDSLTRFIEDQRDTLARCPSTQRLIAVAAIRGRLDEVRLQPQPWLAELVRPAPKPDEKQPQWTAPKTQKQIDEEWVAEWERTIDNRFPAGAGDISVTAREEFDKLTAQGGETWNTMRRLRKDNPALFNAAKALFDRKDGELPQ